MRILFVILLFLVTSNLKGQESSIYYKNGKLRVDTTLQIDSSRFNEILRIERHFLPTFYNRLSYPEIGRENNIHGLMIVKVTVDKANKLVEKRIVKGLDPHMDKLVFKVIENLEWLLTNTMLNDNLFEFYLPILFELEESKFEEDLKENGAVTIKSNYYNQERIIIK